MSANAYLSELNVENLAVVEQVRLSLGRGLVVLTGETGVGKSIVVDAVKLLTGAKARTDLIRSGTERAVVEGVFRQVPRRVLERLEEAGVDLLDGEPGEVLVRRVLVRSGASSAYINDRRVGLPLLTEVGAALVDIQGQHAARSLMSEAAHGALLDALGGLDGQAADYRSCFGELKQALEALNAAESGRQEAEARAAFLHFAIDEISRADPDPEQDELLVEELTRLANVERLRTESGTAYKILYGADSAVLGRLAELSAMVDDMGRMGAQVGDTGRMIADSRMLLEEAADSLRHQRDESRPDPDRQAVVEQRIAVLEGLKRKYGKTLEEVLVTAQDYQNELDGRGDVSTLIDELCARRDDLLIEALAQAEALHRARQTAGDTLTETAHAGLAALAMPHARLTVTDTPVTSGITSGGTLLGPEGHSRMHFLLAANPGEAAKPLAKVASGGELSRIMLALKVALIHADPTPCLVFDEVDSGIGGAVAEQVGRMLKGLSAPYQVFCVTHLPQIASLADQHLLVTKRTDGIRTRTGVAELNRDQRVDEVARMLGGVALTDTTRAHAREMLAAP